MINIKRKLLQLEIERESLKKEKDSKSKERLSKCESKIKEIKDDLNLNMKIWKEEKKVVDKLSDLRKKLDKARFDMDSYQKEGKYSEASKYQYEKIPNIKEQIDN